MEVGASLQHGVLSMLRWLIALLLTFVMQLSANAQGYLYAFHGSDTHELDGSYIELGADGSLVGIKVLDAYGPGAIFDAQSPPNSVSSFAITSFGPSGFIGTISCEMYGYLGVASTVVFSGTPASISFSSNLFFPGNPEGEVILGNWEVASVPEPGVASLIFVSLVAIYVNRRPLWARSA